MILFHSIAQGFSALARHKLRALLTMLGMVIGIGTVTGMVSVSEGLNTVVMQQLERIGASNMIVVFRPDWIELEDGRWVRNRTTAFLKYDDALAIQEEAPSVARVLPENQWDLPVEYRGRTKQARITGTTQDYEEGHNWYLDRGRFLQPLDMEREAKVAVIGADIEKDLYPGYDPIGRELTVLNQRFRIIGVMRAKGDNTPDFTGTDNTVIIPITTFRRRFSNSPFVGVFFIRAVTTDAVQQALLEVKAILGRRHRVAADEAFRFFTSDEIIRSVGRVSFVLKAFLGGVASIALVVGGVGIMNMMLVTVTERTQEIGLRKAVGAHRRHILYQFLIEAVVLGAIGGFAGLGLGVLFGKASALIVSGVLSRSAGPTIDWPAVVSIDTAFVAMAVSAAIGILAGLFPAFRAALLPPTDALRHE